MNKTKLIFLVSSIIISLIPNNTFSQNYFSKRYRLNNDSGWDFSTNITSEIFGYTLQLEDGTVNNPDHRRLGFLRLDSSGNQLPFIKIYQDSILSMGAGRSGSFIKFANNNGYALVGYKSLYVSNGRWDRGVL